jgi:hypothetical protein
LRPNLVAAATRFGRLKWHVETVRSCDFFEIRGTCARGQRFPVR